MKIRVINSDSVIEYLTSLGIKEVFNCSYTPGLCDEASKRAKAYLEKADRILNDPGNHF